MRYPCVVPVGVGLALVAACAGGEGPTAPDTPKLSTTAGLRIVNSTADPGHGICDQRECTLREAIRDSGSTEIRFAPGVTGPITLARSSLGGGTLVISRSLTITGPSAGIVIQRRSADPAFRLLRIGSGVTVRLSYLNLRNGKTDLPGGGIINFGTLTLAGCTVAGNSTTQHGGGIDNHGPLTLTDTKVVNNTATGAGGGIHGHGAALTLTNSTVARNSAAYGGGGISHQSGPLRITNSGVSYNTGIGIWQNWGSSVLDRVRILGNSGNGVVLSHARMTLTNSTVGNNNTSGLGSGGLWIGDDASLRITGSTVANNTGDGVRSSPTNISAESDLVVTNSTVSGNTADGISIAAHGYEVGTTTAVVNTTISANGGHGLRHEVQYSYARLGLVNTLIAGNRASTAPDMLATIVGESSEAIIDASYNLIGDGTGSGLTNEDGNQVGKVSPYTAPIDPLLGPLANNGGPTSTHALLFGSPAIDAASTADCPAVDQRGVARPQGASCDIGSYERE